MLQREAKIVHAILTIGKFLPDPMIVLVQWLGDFVKGPRQT